MVKIMNNGIKLNVSIYGIVSAITFICLILTQTPGISVFLFFLIQISSLIIILKNRIGDKNLKGLFLMLPILIIALNSFVSSSYLLGPTNFLAIVILYSVMFLVLNNELYFKNISINSFLKMILNAIEPFLNFVVPFKWYAERSKNNDKNLLVRRIVIGIVISMPCALFLIIMLSSADMVFRSNFNSFLKSIEGLFEFFNAFKLILGTFVGLYLFGHLYSVFKEDEKSLTELTVSNNSIRQIKGDLVILNILLVSLLAIYTVFIAIQFKYLFSVGNLPNGLNYAEYARRGFFELVFLSILNIALILLTTYLLKDKIYYEKNKWALLTKFMLVYLCLITQILLVSSFYRMSLYDSAYGFTRLRLLVYMFLIFEEVGLIATLVYIIKRNFNIIAVYAVVGLAFYLTLNLVKIDEIIARRNIDMYLAGATENLDINYLTSLSFDAAPEIIRLLDEEVDFMTRNQARIYLEAVEEYYSSNNDWRSYNLQREKTKKLLVINKDKLDFKY